MNFIILGQNEIIMKAIKIISLSLLILIGVQSYAQPEVRVNEANISGNMVFLKLGLYDSMESPEYKDDQLSSVTGFHFHQNKIEGKEFNTLNLDLKINHDIMVSETTAYIIVNVHYSNNTASADDDVFLGETTMVIDKVKSENIIEYLNSDDSKYVLLKTEKLSPEGK